MGLRDCYSPGVQWVMTNRLQKAAVLWWFKTGRIRSMLKVRVEKLGNCGPFAEKKGEFTDDGLLSLLHLEGFGLPGFSLPKDIPCEVTMLESFNPEISEESPPVCEAGLGVWCICMCLWVCCELVIFSDAYF